MKRLFRIGSTSYIYPDDILSNVRKLAGTVQDVELVLFEIDEYGTNLPDAAAIAELNSQAAKNDLTFTVHLPLDLRHGDPVSFEKARHGIVATRDLNAFAYVMHLDGHALLGEPSREAIMNWQKDASHAVSQIVEWVGDAQRVCVENIEAWDPMHFRDLVAAAGASRCVDVGHLWLRGADPIPHLIENLPRTRVIHIHGIGSRDHQSLSLVPQEKLRAVVDLLLREEYRGVVTLEVFGVDDFSSSLAALKDAIDVSEAE